MARYDKQWHEKVKIKTKEYFKNLPEEHRKILQENGRKSVKIMHLKRKQKPFEELKAWTAIRRRIFEERGRVCEKCGWKEQNKFNGKIPVQVNHKNGDNTDHRKENLEILCPNCHSLTEHFMFYGKKHEGCVLDTDRSPKPVA